MVSFIHTADWQLGKPFGNIRGDAGAFLRKQRIETIGTIGRLATDKKVDFIVVAGDVFDSNIPDHKTVMQAFRQMGESFDGKWFLLPGNHDSAEVRSVWTTIRESFSSENVVCLDEARPYRMADLKTVILPAPLKRRQDARDLTTWFDEYEGVEVDIRIGLAHGSLDILAQGREDAPNTITAKRVESARLDYLALGDWHGTLQAEKRIWYSGTPEPDRFRDNNPGNVLLVSIEKPGALPDVTPLETKHFLWCEFEKEIFRAQDIGAVRQELADTRHPLDRIVLRLSLSGTVNFEERELLDNELDDLAATLTYMEKDLSGLLESPSDDDLDEIEQVGFVRIAVEKLLAKMNSGDSQESKLARIALHKLYVENKKLDK